MSYPFFPFLDVLLGSTEYSTSLDMWGVGCIFVEMVTGMPTFPGIRDTYDQLDKIFKLLGTPTEDTWQGVTHFPGYKPHKLGELTIVSDYMLMFFFPVFRLFYILCSFRFLPATEIRLQFSSLT